MEFATQRFQIEHIHPLSRGGHNQPDNLALACNGCNSHKHNKISAFDPISRAEISLFHPRTHIWGEHFAWGVDVTLVFGLTPTGRATVETLRLNRIELVQVRRILQKVHLHPPT